MTFEFLDEFYLAKTIVLKLSMGEDCVTLACFDTIPVFNKQTDRDRYMDARMVLWAQLTQHTVKINLLES